MAYQRSPRCVEPKNNTREMGRMKASLSWKHFPLRSFFHSRAEIHFFQLKPNLLSDMILDWMCSCETQEQADHNSLHFIHIPSLILIGTQKWAAEWPRQRVSSVPKACASLYRWYSELYKTFHLLIFATLPNKNRFTVEWRVNCASGVYRDSTALVLQVGTNTPVTFRCQSGAACIAVP